MQIGLHDGGTLSSRSRAAKLLLIGAAWLDRDADAAGAWRAVRRDAGRHRSPNAGWPEAAMAGALGLRLAGPRIYGSVRVEDGWMGDGRAEAGIHEGLRIAGLAEHEEGRRREEERVDDVEDAVERGDRDDLELQPPQREEHPRGARQAVHEPTSST